MKQQSNFIHFDKVFKSGHFTANVLRSFYARLNASRRSKSHLPQPWVLEKAREFSKEGRIFFPLDLIKASEIGTLFEGPFGKVGHTLAL